MKLILLVSLTLSALPSLNADAKDIYQAPNDFISQTFNLPANGDLPKAKVFWIDDETQGVIELILAHKFTKMRLRYWQQANETIWIMDEIGKELPITVAIHIKDSQIAQTKVLVYRESRGDEIRHGFFTDQFKSAKLNGDLTLDQHIDGITGATLSVRALTKLSRIALWLDAHVNNR